MIKIGNTTYNKAAVAAMSFKDFKESHSHLSIDYKAIYKACGGKITKGKK